MNQWKSVNECPPPQGEVIETKIDDQFGCRLVQCLSLTGRLWFVPDRSMYVYYTPTHWREAQKVRRAE